MKSGPIKKMTEAPHHPSSPPTKAQDTMGFQKQTVAYQSPAERFEAFCKIFKDPINVNDLLKQIVGPVPDADGKSLMEFHFLAFSF